MEGMGLLDQAASARLAAARSGVVSSVRLRIAELGPGDVGVLEAQVRLVAPPRTYSRKRGGEGLVGRVTLADDSGEIDLVLWDDETRLCKDGPLQPGALVRIHGPAVKAGYRGGIELGLGGAHLVALPAPAPGRTLAGLLVSLGEVRPVGAPPALRFTCDAVVSLGLGEVRVTLWDQAVKSARAAGVGARVRLPSAEPNPFLDGWWTARTLEPVAPAAPVASATLK